MTSLEIRLADADDAERVGAVLDALDLHYRGADAARPSGISAAMVRRSILEYEGTHFMLALDGEVPVGVACFAVLRPGRKLQGLIFLKDLFVVEVARRHGVGSRLMQSLARFARERGIGRIDLQTDRANDGARRLYDMLGGTQRQNVLAYTFSTEAVDRMSANDLS